MRATDVATRFTARINGHDVSGLSELMTDDHVFVDALDSRISGRGATRLAWEQYFKLVPDYWVKVEQTFENPPHVALFGSAGGTYAEGSSGQGAWRVPAAWLAEVRDGKVALWRVYADNLPLRKLMGLECG